MTVSNVVNRAGKASPATVAAVRRAIDELGYVPNLAARRLASTRATTVGLIYPSRHTPFLDAILTGTLRAANAQHFQLVIREGDGASRDEAEGLADALVKSGADALILVPPFAEWLSGTGILDRLGVPAAAIATGSALPGLITIRIDNRAAMRAVTGSLIARGHRRIGFVAGPAGHTVSAERILGHRDALDAHGLADDVALYAEGAFTFDSGVAAAGRLLALDEPPTAIVASSDDMAAGVACEAQRRGLRLPDALAVTGFDDTTLASNIWPPLTAVRQPVEHMAHRAAHRLIELLQQPPDATADPDEVVDYLLVERESSGAPPRGG